MFANALIGSMLVAVLVSPTPLRTVGSTNDDAAPKRVATEAPAPDAVTHRLQCDRTPIAPRVVVSHSAPGKTRPKLSPPSIMVADRAEWYVTDPRTRIRPPSLPPTLVPDRVEDLRGR